MRYKNVENIFQKTLKLRWNNFLKNADATKTSKKCGIKECKFWKIRILLFGIGFFRIISSLKPHFHQKAIGSIALFSRYKIEYFQWTHVFIILSLLRSSIPLKIALFVKAIEMNNFHFSHF